MSALHSQVPVLGFAAFSGTGKTTLLEALLPNLRAKGLRLAMVKHAHHSFDVDQPGKDSYRLRKAGAEQMLIASKKRRALMVETPDAEVDPDLNDLLAYINPKHCDLILVEGFKHQRFAKIELHRPALGKPLLFPQDDSVIAVACDEPLPQAGDMPLLDLNNIEEISAFVLSWLQAQTGKPIPEPA